MNSDFGNLVTAFCNSLEALWAVEEFKPKPHWPSGITRRFAQTEVSSSEAPVLQRTNRPVRGYSGVEVRLREKQRSSAEQARELIVDSSQQVESYQPPALQRALSDFRDALTNLSAGIDQDPGLSYRLYGAQGFKTWAPNEFANFKKRDSWKPEIPYLFSLADLLSKLLCDLGFDSADRFEFDAWDQVSESLAKQLRATREQDQHEYEVRIYLNGPPIDFETEVIVADLSVNDRPIQVALGPATDEALDPLVEYQVHPAYDRVNTLIAYKASLPVEAAETEYLEEYGRASLVAEFVLDSLRLCRPSEDIGVLAVKVVPTSPLAPDIRDSWKNRYRDDLARFEPRRFDFSPSSTLPLSDAEIVDVKQSVQDRLPTSGLDWRFRHAISRFRNSIEKYSPEDPERILEYAIALEALYLNDASGNTELTYRLSLRVARFLEQERCPREQLFELMKSLYGFRSKIAHGSDLASMKQGKQNELKKVLEESPAVVARSIVKLLRAARESPSVSSKEFWRRVEFG